MSKYAEKYKKLAERLSKLSEVTRYDKDEDKEAWTLSHSFLDLEESFNKFNKELLPKLSQDDLSDEEIKDILLDIGDEFRHILHHIKDPKSLRVYTEEIKDEK